jgi:hypothetical protein
MHVYRFNFPEVSTDVQGVVVSVVVTYLLLFSTLGDLELRCLSGTEFKPCPHSTGALLRGVVVPAGAPGASTNTVSFSALRTVVTAHDSSD